MYKVYYFWEGSRINVGTGYATEREARKVVARKARYNKYCFIEKVSKK
jgi:hypothetical protein